VEDYTNLKHVYVDVTEAQRKAWHYITYGDPEPSPSGGPGKP